MQPCPQRFVLELPPFYLRDKVGYDAGGVRKLISAMFRDQYDCDHLAHVINLTGPAASGKTRLALAVAEDLEQHGVVTLLRLSVANMTSAEVLAAIPKARPILVILEEAERLAEWDLADLVEILQGQEGIHCILVSQRQLRLPEASKPPMLVRAT